ncbi:site-2 protease family protein [Aquicella lusitana]|uniref:Zinc metalloprotease n=1 Tax=Aquicella lusitana TaxID=254246 RepID=A0A370GE34_9COXI|nr:site-2 protease family protein [Aquicella lusitana]RDI42058.1 Zn-dependent protease [Aquicella lusitana]VVC74435.1 Putative zinc metalloprotease Rip3 [Aquicella lusitana]
MKPHSMEKSGLYLFSLFGFEVRLDWSWFFLAILVAWSLSVSYFPFNYPDLDTSTYWTMGIIGAIGLFLSIIFHELCHSLVGRHYGLPIAGIKLFIFGGVAEMREMPPSPKAEFMMAIAGPAFSIVIGILLYILFRAGTLANWPDEANGIIRYLGLINIIVGIFNLLPAFPLDGGRVLRSFLWWWKDDLRWATQVAARAGAGFGFGMILFGLLLVIQGAFISGLWMFLLGFFLQYLSKTSYQELLIRELFGNESIRKYVKTDPVAVNANITLQALVDDYFYKYYHKLYPVMEDEKLVGSISFNDIKQTQKEKWPSLRVREIMQTCPSENVIDADTKVIRVLQLMSAQNNGRLIVTKAGKLYGIITLKDLMSVIFIRMNLEIGEGERS